MVKPKTEIDFLRLLNICEDRARKDLCNVDWRFVAYIQYLEEKYIDLKNEANKPALDILFGYGRRLKFLKDVVKAKDLSDLKNSDSYQTPILPAVKQMPNEELTAELYHKLSGKHEKRERDELFASCGGHVHQVEQDVDSVLEKHHEQQEKIADGMLSLVRSFKEQSLIASEIVKKDTEVLYKSSNLSEQNYEHLNIHTSALQQHNKSKCSCWTWLLLAAACLMFVGMILFMRRFKKKQKISTEF